MEFTNSMGEAVYVNPNETQIVENNPQYTVYAARTNPGGEQVTKVVYKNPESLGDGSFAEEEMIEADPEEITPTSAVEAADIEQSVGEYGNPRMNPKGTLFNWRNLRLQGAISSQGKTKKAIGNLAGILRFAKREISANQSIRDNDTLLRLTTGADWYKYTQHLRKSPVDMGAEHSADISKSERASVALFLMEWDRDPGHVDLQRRMTDGADMSDVLYKGQIVFDVMTGRWSSLQSAGYGGLKYDKMYRLAFDIVRSMPLNAYNYYTVNEMHVDEGDRVYADFRSRYVPLEHYEVEVVKEIENEFSAKGSAYAFQTTASEAVGLEAARLMKMVIARYNVGDTRTVRALVNQLTEAPFNYRPQSTKPGSRVRTTSQKTDDAGNRSKTSKGREAVRYVTFKVDVAASNKVNKNWKEYVTKVGEFNAAWVKGLKDSEVDKGNKLGKGDKAPNSFQIVKSERDSTPVILATKGAKDGWVMSDFKSTIGKHAKLATGEDYDRAGKNLNVALNPKKKNPASKGRGNYLHIEIHPKNQLKIKKREPHGKAQGYTKGPAKAETRYGNTMKGSMTTYTRGLNKHFPGMLMVQVGTHKKTGEEVPFRIRVPKSHFGVKAHPDGIRTIGIKKDVKKLTPAWQKFVDYYGLPNFKSSADTHHRFPISKEHQGVYYDAHRRKLGAIKS